MILHACTRCREGRSLLMRTGESEWLCAACWRRAGCPEAYRAVESVKTRHEAEEAVRRSMLRRGGKDAYMVKAGKS